MLNKFNVILPKIKIIRMVKFIIIAYKQTLSLVDILFEIFKNLKFN